MQRTRPSPLEVVSRIATLWTRGQQQLGRHSPPPPHNLAIVSREWLSLLTCMCTCAKARSRLLGAVERAGLAAASFEVLFSGVEEGRVEAVLRAVPPGEQPALTGLESSVVDGEGFGIEPFRSVVCPKSHIATVP